MTDNAISVSTLIASGTTEFLETRDPIFNTANREYEGMFTQKNFATGGNIQIKVPGYGTVQRGSTVTAEAIDDLVVNYPIVDDDIYNATKQVGVYQQIFDILGGKRALVGDDKKAIVDNYAYPAYETLSAAIAKECVTKLKTNAYFSTVDTVESLSGISTFADINAITTLMNSLSLSNKRYLMMNLTDAGSVANNQQNAFNVALNTNISKEARIGGPDKGRFAGIDLYQAVALDAIHESGTLAQRAGMTVVSIAADGLSITIDGVPSDMTTQVLAGDRFSVPSVFLYNNVYKTVLRTKFTFVAAEDTDGNGDGTITIPVNYPLLATGQHAYLSALPGAGAPVYCFPDHALNFAYVPSGLNVACVPMTDVYGAINSDVRGNVNVPTKVYLQGLATDLNNIFRISMLAGIKAITPYIVCTPSAVS